MAKAAKNEVDTIKAKAQLPAEFADMLVQDAGAGSELANRDDMTIPFIKIAQALSDEVNKRESTYIEGLEVGDFFDTATHKIWKGEAGLTFIPVFYEREYIEWVPRSRGGGFQGKHDESILKKVTIGEKGENFLPNGNEIVVTGTWYSIIVNKETLEFDQVVMSFSKTQFKKSRGLMTNIKQLRVPHPSGKGTFNPPMFYNLVDAISVPESNDQGNWMGWKMALNGNVFGLGEGAEELYDLSKSMLEAVRSGRMKAEVPQTLDDANPDSKTIDGKSSRADETIPF